MGRKGKICLVYRLEVAISLSGGGKFMANMVSTSAHVVFVRKADAMLMLQVITNGDEPWLA